MWPWHYVNIPIHPPAGVLAAYDGARDCRGGDCVVAAVERFAAVLSDSSAPARQRLEALKFVVHFVADLHQPLHASNNDDRGGNGVAVVLAGRRASLASGPAKRTPLAIKTSLPSCRSFRISRRSTRPVVRFVSPTHSALR